MQQLTNLDPASLERFTRDWEAVFDRGDHHALASFYTDDAKLIGTHLETVSGRPAIEAFWRTACDGARAAGVNRRVHLTEVETSGDLAILQGTVVLRTPTAPNPTTVRYVTVWRRQPDHTWRISVDISSAAPPPR